MHTQYSFAETRFIFIYFFYLWHVLQLTDILSVACVELISCLHITYTQHIPRTLPLSTSLPTNYQLTYSLHWTLFMSSFNLFGYLDLTEEYSHILKCISSNMSLTAMHYVVPSWPRSSLLPYLLPSIHQANFHSPFKVQFLFLLSRQLPWACQSGLESPEIMLLLSVSVIAFNHSLL